MSETVITKNPGQKQLKVAREFNGPLDLVWSAWTEGELLDKWWAPRPWKAETAHMDFKEGGYWMYSMNGPDGEQHWSKAEYEKIIPKRRFIAINSFCDKAGRIDPGMPVMLWNVSFAETATGTMVEVLLSFDTAKDLEKILEMGFGEGFTAAHENLDRYLEVHFSLRKQNKTSNASRVTTYLNFPGKTEEAFNFYKEVFNGEFTGSGLQRFQDVELPDEHPPMSDEGN